MTNHLDHVVQLADVVRAWTVRTLRARYQQSALGWLWVVIQPVATVAIFTVVFTRFVRVDTGDVPYIVFSYTAVAPWALLASALPDMASSLVTNLNLVTKIYFPRAALPLAAFAARVVDFAISAVILVVLVLAYGIRPSFAWLVYLPVVFLVQAVLILGLGLGAAALNVYYRDVDPVLKLGIQIWFYASPIIYPVALVPQQWHWLYFANPMAGVIESYRAVLLGGQAPGWNLVSAGALSLVAFVLGYGFFTRAEGRFADVI
ncbi:MAG TPA: ABC transporter permease [Vicinamibacterales bacterium]|nr:ABC transporter permease [Vicinamibacterales bacterium]